MPFFLVSQTRLLEAENETQAAAKALAETSVGQHIKFMVKFDEEHVTEVVVTAALAASS